MTSVSFSQETASCVCELLRNTRFHTEEDPTFGLIPCYFESFNNLLRTPYFPSSLIPASCEARSTSPHFSTRTQTPPGHGLLKDWLLPSCCFPIVCQACVRKARRLRRKVCAHVSKPIWPVVPRREVP